MKKDVILNWLGKHKFVILALALLVSILFVYHLKLSLLFLWPSNNGFFFIGDWAQHYLSWEFFRLTPWQMPLGTIENYFYPVGANIGFTDSIPLLALIFKPFSQFLSQDFQYIGIWFLLCMLLQAFFGVLFLTAIKIKNPVSLYAGAMLFASSPVMINRIGHPALSAHWLLVASLWIYFRKVKKTDYKGQIYQLLILFLSALIHPYLVVMVCGLALAYFVRLYLVDRSINIYRFFALLGSSVLIVMLTWYVIGYFSIPASNAWTSGGGFTKYSANLLGFLNPFEISTFLPAIPLRLLTHWEGFSYLGLGMILLTGVVTIMKLVEIIYEKEKHNKDDKKGWRWFMPLLVVSLAASAFSLSNIVEFGPYILFQYPLPDFALNIGEAFRASGRFMWIPYYVLFAMVFYLLSKLKIRDGIIMLLLLAALAIQLIDTAPLYQRYSNNFGKYESVLSEEWDSLIEDVDIIIMYPPFQRNYLSEDDYAPFMYLALQHRVPITTGHLARYDTEATSQYLNEINISLIEGVPQEGAIYITTPKYEDIFSNWLAEKLVRKKILDGYTVFVPSSN